MNDLAHLADPWTSHHAAVTLDQHQRQTLKDALILLLAEAPRTGDELTRAYVNNAEVNGWPLFTDLHNVKRRLSELHTRHHVIKKSATHRLSVQGKPAIVWELSMPAEQARVTVGSRS